MPGRVTPLKKPRNTTHLPLALNPMKSQDVLAVLAERNEAIVPVGAWVEPASPNCKEIPAHTSAYIIEGELKEQQRRKQEALKHFQRQVKYRVNQHIRLRKKQQLQKSYEAVEKEGSIAMRSSDRAYLTPKRTSVFPSNLNAAIGSSILPPSQMLEDTVEDGENHSELFQQAQATAPSEKPENVNINTETREFPLKTHQDLLTTVHCQNFVDNQESDCKEISSVMTDEKQRALICGNQQDLLSEDKDKSLSRVQGLQDILPEAQDCLLEAQGDLSVEIRSIKLNSPRIEPDSQATGPEGKAMKTETLSTELEDENVEMDVQELLSKCQDQDSLSKDHCVLPKDQNILCKYQDQNFLPKTCHIVHKEQNILFKSQDQDFLQGDQNFLLRDQYVLPQSQSIPSKYQNQDFLPKCEDQDFLFKDQNILYQYREHDFQSKNQKVRFQEPFSGRTGEKGRDVSSVDHQYRPSKFKFQDFLGDQSLYFRQKLSVGTAEKCREDLPLDGHQHLPNRHPRDTCRRRQVCGEDQSGLNTEFQVPLAFHSGVDQEEDKKERQKQYLRYRRLFMDIEREQVKEQKREREQKKKIEKIKKRKEQQRFAEEQRILTMKCQKETYSEEKMSDLLAQLQLEEIKGAKEKQQQKEKEYVRYVEALRAQVQEKMKLYNITLPPLCCCGPDFWDAHPDTCANNCIFYKNHRAYNRALHSVINSSDISEGNSTLRSAIRNFASANRRTLKRISNKNLKSTETTSSISTF
ncbi:coiled-coil domain-containing protein 15 isoform X2 [Perognathus longimembris pacificus]|uniref:coiled-coil domain-containing protein 15 isoform X2 n=1 Tax=Perognathus longimembris pacificus TaxID=214514 RepID=UPI00201956CA|nr:coiled-coil domain-containing protein 15 isoform X2 [Perognathus longimembris pacificus]